MKERDIYRALKTYNTAKAVKRSVETGDPMPILKRLLRLWLGKSAGRAMGKILR